VITDNGVLGRAAVSGASTGEHEAGDYEMAHFGKGVLNGKKMLIL
jgi:enolase